MTPFELAIDFLMREETGGDPNGGYNDRPTDRGGPTKWGISQAAFPDEDIPNLTRPRAVHLAHEHYWLPGRCDRLPTPLAICQLDFAYNSGEDTASMALQRLVGAKPDGDIGDRTIAALSSFTAGRGIELVTEQFVLARADYIVSLVDEPEKPRERTNLKNLKGWTRRLIRVLGYSLRHA